MGSWTSLSPLPLSTPMFVPLLSSPLPPSQPGSPCLAFSLLEMLSQEWSIARALGIDLVEVMCSTPSTGTWATWLCLTTTGPGLRISRGWISHPIWVQVHLPWVQCFLTPAVPKVLHPQRRTLPLTTLFCSFYPL